LEVAEALLQRGHAPPLLLEEGEQGRLAAGIVLLARRPVG
jgi:hypothetical protein